MLSRRKLITGLISLAAAPAIVRASSLMPVKVMKPVLTPEQMIEIIMKPAMDRLEQQIADAIIYGSSYNRIDHIFAKFDGLGIELIPVNSFYGKFK